MGQVLAIDDRQAEDFGDFGLKVVLENQVADETRHKEEIERIIAGWDADADVAVAEVADQQVAAEVAEAGWREGCADG